jgi:biotin carboxyl carrier protein
MARVHQFRFRGRRVTVTVDGERVTLAPDGETPRVLDAGANGRTRGVAVATRDGVWVTADGFTAFLEYADAEHAAGRAPSADEVRAPMTGTVVQVAVGPGADVAAGQVLVVLTAMKMEYKLEAPRAGTVADVACAAGQQVELGQVLVALAPTA